jgi:hypothetical protein
MSDTLGCVASRLGEFARLARRCAGAAIEGPMLMAFALESILALFILSKTGRRTGRVAVATGTQGGAIVRRDGIVAPQRDRSRQIAQAAAKDRLAVKTAANGRIPLSAIAFAVVTSLLEEDFQSWRASRRCSRRPTLRIPRASGRSRPSPAPAPTLSGRGPPGRPSRRC